MLKTSSLPPFLASRPILNSPSSTAAHGLSTTVPSRTAERQPNNTLGQSSKRWWQGGVRAAFAVMVLVGISRPAAACAWYNPLCFLEDEFKLVWGAAIDSLKLEWDIITLNPKDAWDDFEDVAAETVCGAYPLRAFIVAHGVEEYFDSCESGPESIGDDILAKLRLYFKSDLGSVRIHKNCHNITPQDATTFGEHIYFGNSKYEPHTDDGFALLAHELTHVLQYRKQGFLKFVCTYATKCSFGRDHSCAVEDAAYRTQNMVLEDRMRDRDGIFTCPLGPWDGSVPDCTRNPLFVACNSTTSGPKPSYCKQIDNCPNRFNQGQEDIDGNLTGNACDIGWSSDPWRPMEFQSFGDFNGDGKTDILVQVPRDTQFACHKGSCPNAIGILTYEGGSLKSLMVASPGAWFGSWQYFPTDHIVAIADFNGDGKDDILITNDWGMGILTYDGTSLTSLMVAPNQTRFENSLGGWLFQADGNRIAGVTDLNRDGKQDIVVTSAWGIGILTFDGSSLTPLMLAPNDTWFGGWKFDPLHNSIVGFGDFNYDGTPDIVIRSDNYLGILTLDGNTLTSLMVASDGTYFGGWKFDAKTDHIAGIGHFFGGGDQILVTGKSGLAMLGGTERGSRLENFVQVSSGSSVGGWVLDTRANSIGAIGRFTDPSHDDVIIRSPWGIGILTPKTTDNLGLKIIKLTASMLAPSDTRFGGWLYNSAGDKILGRGKFRGLSRDDILIGSQWGIGLLSFSPTSKALTSGALVPNNTWLGSWLFRVSDPLGVDKDIGPQTLPTWVSGHAQ